MENKNMDELKKIVFIDSEIGVKSHRILDLGALKPDGTPFHSPDLGAFLDFISGADYLCGHNIIHHDLRYLAPHIGSRMRALPLDTLYLSPLLFPKRPYHGLLKDDKLQSCDLNNPLTDSMKAKDLFYDEVQGFS